MGAQGSNRKYSDVCVSFRVHASHAAGAWIAFAALGTGVLVANAPAPIAGRILVATWIACAALEAIHSRALLRGPRGARHLRIDSGAVEIEDGTGRVRTGTLRPGSFVAPWLTIVRWRPDGARFDRSLPLVPGMAGGEALRRLRVLLRLG